jgi:hypothetical protein
LLDITEVEVAVVASVVLQETRGDDVEVGNYIRERGGDILVPIGCTVAHDETLQVVSLRLLVNSDKLVVLVNLPSEVWHVDSGV